MAARLRITTIIICAGFLAGCAEFHSAHQSQEFGKYLRDLRLVTAPCVEQPHENREYLLKACEHIKKNKIEVTSHPNTWKVTLVRDETIQGQTWLAVHFSCCGPGDVAFFDKTTGEVAAYARKTK
jgi:hypothetical protein